MTQASPVTAQEPAEGRLGWGLVGTGEIAEHFAADLKRVPGSRLVGVVSRSQGNASAFADRYGATAHPGLASMLGDAAISAVYVASPNDSHHRIALASLSAGKSVLVEKPLAITAAQAEEMAALAAQRGLFLMEGIWTRFLPAMRFVKDAVETGLIGEVQSLTGELAFHRDYDPKGRFFDPQRGGGALLDLGVYLISLSLALLGRPDTTRGTWQAAQNGVDISAEIELAFGKARARLSCGFDRNGANLFVIKGSKGSLILQPPFIGARMVVEAGNAVAEGLGTIGGASAFARAARKAVRILPVPGLKRHDFSYPGYGLHFEIDAAAQAIAAGRTEHPLSPLADSVETLRIIETVRRASPAPR